MKYHIEITTKGKDDIPLAFPTEDDLADMPLETRKEWEQIGKTDARDELGKEYVYARITDFEGLQAEPEPTGNYRHLITQQRIALRSNVYEPTWDNTFKALLQVLEYVKVAIEEHEKTKKTQKS